MRYSVLFLILCGSAFAANHFIREGAAGTGDGSDWTNATVSWPATFVRGDTYYVADGSYATATRTTFATVESGASYITIKKAITADHGTETGWAAGYGDGVANLGPLAFSTGYWIFDGQVGGGPNASDPTSWKTGHGFKLTGIAAKPKCISLNEYSPDESHNYFEFRHMEITHSSATPVEGVSGTVTGHVVGGKIWDGSAGVRSVTLDGSASAVDSIYNEELIKFVNGGVTAYSAPVTYNGTTKVCTLLVTVPNTAITDGVTTYTIYTRDRSGSMGIFACSHLGYTTDYVTISECYIHTFSNVAILSDEAHNWTIEKSWFAWNGSASWAHGEPWAAYATSHVVFRWNVIEDGCGTGQLVLKFVNANSPAIEDWKIYGNIFFRTRLNPWGRTGGGGSVIDCYASDDSKLIDIKFHNNTIYEQGGGRCGVYLSHGTGCEAYNNLFYNCWTDGEGYGNPHMYNTTLHLVPDYNTYLVTDLFLAYRAASHGAHDFIDSSLASDPYTDPQTYDFTMTKPTTAGVTLSAPYNVDMYGITRGADATWDRGAIEYGSGVGSLPDVTGVSNQTATVGTPFSITVGGAGAGVTFAISNNPTWLSIHSTTGVLSGTAAYPGFYRDIVVSVTNTVGTVTTTFNVEATTGTYYFGGFFRSL
jgi:hypothetical protein